MMVLNKSAAARKDVPESDELAGPVHIQDGSALAPQNDPACGTVEVSAGVESAGVGRAEQPVACPRSNGSQAGTQALPVDTNSAAPQATINPSQALKHAVGHSQAAWAKEHGLSPTYVSDVINGRRDPGEAILEALGLERVVTYRVKQHPLP